MEHWLAKKAKVKGGKEGPMQGSASELQARISGLQLEELTLR